MEDKILARSTPKPKPSVNPSEDVIQIPILRKVGRPKNPNKEVKKPLKKVGFDNKIQTYSSALSSTSNSKFGLMSSTFEKTEFSDDSSSEDETKIESINSWLQNPPKMNVGESIDISAERNFVTNNNTQKIFQDTIILDSNDKIQKTSILKDFQNFSFESNTKNP